MGTSKGKGRGVASTAPMSPGSPSVCSMASFWGASRFLLLVIKGCLRQRAARGLLKEVGLFSGALGVLSWALPATQEKGQVRVGSSSVVHFHFLAPGLHMGLATQSPLSTHLGIFVLGNSAVSRWSQASALCLAQWGTVSLFIESATLSESGVFGPSGGASVGFGARGTGFKGWLSPYLCVALGTSPNFPALSFPTWEWA